MKTDVDRFLWDHCAKVEGLNRHKAEIQVGMRELEGMVG
jgi:hypothetical protein